MIDNKLLNEQGGFLLRLMNQSLYGGEDFYDYLDIFKQRDKECSIYYQLAENMDILKKEHDFNYKVKFKKFPEEFKKVNMFIEVRDARIPNTSYNNELIELLPE